MAYVLKGNKAVHEGSPLKELHTRTWIWRPTRTGGIETNRRTGIRTVYKVGEDGIARPVKKLPPLKSKELKQARLSRR